MKKIAISIVNYNSADDILSLVKSLKIFNKHEYEIFIIDNNSKQGDLKKLDIIKDFANIYKCTDNLGFAKAQNINIQKIISKKKFEYVLICNPDVLFTDKGTFKKLIEESIINNAKITGPLVTYYPETDKIYFAGGYVDKYTSVTKMNLKNKNIDKISLNDSFECDFITGCCMLVSLDVFNKVGFIPEEYFLYFEESDFCLKAKENGIKIFLIPSTKVYHKVSSSIGYLSNTYLYYMIRNFLKFGKKYTKKKYLPFFYTYYFFVWVTGYTFLAIKQKNYKGILYIIKGLLNLKY